MSKFIKSALPAAAALALTVGMAQANDAPLAYVEGALAIADYPESGWGSDYTPFVGGSIGGAVKLEYGDDLNLEIDGSFTRLLDETHAYDVYSATLAAHLYKQDGDQAYGFFGGINGNSPYYSGSQTDKNIFAGLDYFNSLSGDTFYHAQLGVFHQVDGEWDRLNPLYFGEVAFDHFSDPNTRLSAGLGFAFGEFGDSQGEDTEALTWSLGAERRFGGGSNISSFARLNGFINGSPDMSKKATTLSIGVKYTFGNDSLQDAYRKGPTMKTFDFTTVSWLSLDNW